MMENQDKACPGAAPSQDGANMPNIVQTIERMRAAMQRIVQDISIQEAKFRNVLRPLAHAENVFRNEVNAVAFYAAAHPDPSFRRACTQARHLLDEFGVEQTMNEPLFFLVNAVVERGEKLDAEDARLLVMKYTQYVRSGLLLPDQSTRERLREIRRLISKDSSLFRANLANTDEGLWYSRDDLEGVPESMLSNFELGTGENKGLLKVLFRDHHLAAVLRHAKNSELRRNVFIANENQLPQNVDLFRNIIILRHEAARLLGYSSHASLKLADRMARTPETVEVFHEDLRTRLQELSTQESLHLHRLKAQDVGFVGRDDEMHYYLWDQPYYNRLMLERYYNVDQESLSEYFPLQIVVERMLSIMQDIFAFKFVGIDGAGAGPYSHVDVWHKDVEVFATYDEDNNGAFLGWLYIDLYERPGKKVGAANYNLVPGFLYEDESRQHPSTALLCSFRKPTLAIPCLLRHDEVVTLFHELGHGIHDLVSKTTWACFHGTEVPVDFGEAPSQMLEYWCWTPSILKLLSRHYSTLSDAYHESWKLSASPTTADPSEPPEQLPDDMIASLIAAKSVNAAHFYLNQLRLSIFDMAVHNPLNHTSLQSMDISAVHNEIRSTIFPPRGPEVLGHDFRWGHGQALNGHAMQDDYSAGYYSYMFSKVFAADMFESTFRKDPLSRAEGLSYRYTVLEKGGSRDPMQLLKDFLGRQPDGAAFDTMLYATV